MSFKLIVLIKVMCFQTCLSYVAIIMWIWNATRKGCNEMDLVQHAEALFVQLPRSSVCFT